MALRITLAFVWLMVTGFRCQMHVPASSPRARAIEHELVVRWTEDTRHYRLRRLALEYREPGKPFPERCRPEGVRVVRRELRRAEGGLCREPHRVIIDESHEEAPGRLWQRHDQTAVRAYDSRRAGVAW
jgi:hypothetical protein